MIKKRGQSQIITSVLIILLVLAAIVIVWQVVSNTVQRGTARAEAAVNCLGINLIIVSVNGGLNSVIVERGVDNFELQGIKIIVEDVITGIQSCSQDFTTGLPSSLSQSTLLTSSCNGLPSGSYKLKIAPKIDGNQCDVTSSLDFKV